jgi:hypothetical protein
MIKLVKKSTAKKTTYCAVTYRAGGADKFATCPKTCNLKPDSSKGAEEIDYSYLDAVSDSVPKGGVSFTYSHFNPTLWKHKLKAGKTTINYSAKNITDMLLNSFVPVVINVKETFWNNKKSITLNSLVPRKKDLSCLKNISLKRIVRCPAEYNNSNCRDCGNGKPLCSRIDRDYAIGFTDHGTYKKKAGSQTEDGGCYATGGNVKLHWEATANGAEAGRDEIQLLKFAEELPFGTVLRHHIAGDFGKC